MPDFDIRTWARRGAEQRLLEIASEAEAIYRAFPELRNRQRGAGAPGRRGRRPASEQMATGVGQAAAKTAGAKRRRKRRGTLSADARKRIADAQRKRWAAWRAKRKS